MRNYQLYIRFCTLIAVAILIEGCAAGRSVVTLEDINQTKNPANGTMVVISSVEDQRQFEVNPKNPFTPSLDPSDQEAVQLKDRLIGRKRNGFGKALGSILLPENETLSSWFQKITTEGFRLAGYRVLTPTDSGFDTAEKVNVSITKYWAWFNPGFWSVTAANESEIKISGNIAPFKDGMTISSQTEGPGNAAITDKDWTFVTNQGAKDLVKEIATQLSK